MITTLKPVVEAESPYVRMDGGVVDWSQSNTSPNQISSPMQDEGVQSNGPPGKESLDRFLVTQYISVRSISFYSLRTLSLCNV